MPGDGIVIGDFVQGELIGPEERERRARLAKEQNEKKEVTDEQEED